MSNSMAPKTAATPIGDLPSHVGNLYHQTFDWLIGNEKWAERVAAKAGFTDVGHTVELFGLCPECASQLS